MSERLRGVVAAITTPILETGQPDLERFLVRADFLLKSGCDGLNVLGTTGEATSLSVRQRLTVMNAIDGSALPVDRMLVGTGAAAVEDAVALTMAAADIGFSGALLLPPFYYKPVSDAGILRFVDALVEATAARPIRLYLYNFPALSGIAYTPALVSSLVRNFGDRIAGLKDSSGDLAYAHEIAALSPSLDVFPSNEATLLMARSGGPFAGCISATANLNSADCALAYHQGDEAALARSVAVRALFDGLPLVPAVKAMVARLTGDAGHARTLPPFAPLDDEQSALLARRYAGLEAVDAENAFRRSGNRFAAEKRDKTKS
ncbi:MAG: 4-hydroxy-tetrahydrodipicolinate synthase [Caulobacter sp.]|nr:4-hydroxy-tetrahydrodipicolinate synthase [Caulobacter sp.]